MWPTNNYETALSLQLDDNGEDIGDPVVAIRVWRFFRFYGLPFPPKLIYEPFFAFFEKKGYREGDDLFEFPYDWRKDTEISSLRLSELVLEVAKKTIAGKVILMAHSLGGMVVRSLMRNPSIHKHIEKVFLFGTPHHGSPTYLSLLLFGKNWPFTRVWWGIGPKLPSGALPIVDLNERDAKRLVRNFPSIYMNAMDFTSKFSLIFDSARPVSAQQLKSLHRGQYNEWMIERSIRFHEELK